MAAAIVGTERVVVLVSRCAVYTELYLGSQAVLQAQKAVQNLRKSLIKLYAAILSLLGRLIALFKNSCGKELTHCAVLVETG